MQLMQTITPNLPPGAHNIRIAVIGEMTTSGDLIELGGIQVTYELPEPEEEPLLIHGVGPIIYQSQDKKYWLVIYFISPGNFHHFWGTTKQQAIHLANEYAKKSVI